MIIKDIVVPFHKKDIHTVQSCVDSIYSVFNPKRVFLVSNEDPKIENCIFVNEREIPVIDIEKIRIMWNLKNPNLSNRSGWIYQQLIKLGIQETVQDISEDYLISDSDVIYLSNPYSNTEDGFFPFSKAFTGEYHLPYRENYFRLMKEETTAGFSFINHNMVFNKEIIHEIKDFIEENNKMKWDVSILQSLDYNQQSGFSEYDLYGNWMYKFHKERCANVQMKIAQVNYIPNKEHIEYFKKSGFHMISSQEWIRK